MANQVYPDAKKGFLDGNISLLDDNIKVLLIDLADYTYSGAHTFLSAVPAPARVSVSPNLSNKTTANGTFDSNNVIFSNVVGDTSEAIILYVDSGIESTSRLIAYYDTNVTGLPVTPNGGSVDVEVNPAGWFSL